LRHVAKGAFQSQACIPPARSLRDVRGGHFVAYYQSSSALRNEYAG
jgi:hypothetical protein